MTNLASHARQFALALFISVCSALASGCANFQLPRIDPSGERVFIYDPPPGAVAAAPPVVAGPAPAVAPGIAAPAVAAAAPAVAVGGQEAVFISPAQVIAPIGTEVVMIGTVVDADGYGRRLERVEWLLSPDSVGNFVVVGERGFLDTINPLLEAPRKIDNRYAVNNTLWHGRVLDRGTPSPIDDITVGSGQTWITVSSPSEGTSHVTAFAPGIAPWDRRQQTATIHWVDAQWSFPPPAINPVGTRHVFTTTVTRQSDGSPLAGYIVRYEIVAGPDAVLGPQGERAAEVVVNELGQASIEIAQRTAAPGTSQINIQVIRPPQGVGGKRFVLGAGSTLKTWTSSELTLRVAGPPQASVGNTITYRIEVTNPGAAGAREVIVSDQAPAGLEFLNSNPAANSSPSGQEWRIGDIAPGQTAVVETNYRVTRAGSFNYCASASASGGMTARSCAVTSAGAPAIEVRVINPPTTQVGSEARFEVEIVNHASEPATGLLITDRFGPGLVHAVSASPIERDLPAIPPGGSTRIAVTFQVTQPGNLCHEITVSGPGGARATTQACVMAVGAQPAPLTPAPTQPPLLQPAPTQPLGTTPPISIPTSPDATFPTTPQPTPSTPANRSPLLVRMSGPAQAKLGDVVEFFIEVTNAGTAAITNMRIADHHELTLEPVQASPGIPDTGELIWTVASLEPGKSVRRQVNCRCVQATNRACNRVEVTADGGVSQADEACLEIQPPGVAAAPAQPAAKPSQLVLSVAEITDPVRMGATAAYQILITNKGDTPDQQVALNVKFEGLAYSGMNSPVTGVSTDRSMRFEPIAEIRAGETVTIEMRFQPTAVGTARLTAEVTSQQHPAPLTEDEATQVLP